MYFLKHKDLSKYQRLIFQTYWFGLAGISTTDKCNVIPRSCAVFVKQHFSDTGVFPTKVKLYFGRVAFSPKSCAVFSCSMITQNAFWQASTIIHKHSPDRDPYIHIIMCVQFVPHGIFNKLQFRIIKTCDVAYLGRCTAKLLRLLN